LNKKRLIVDVNRFPLLSISDAAWHLTQGEVIAYPTEAVYGLGCDPHNEAAVHRVLALKQRPANAGLILIADQFERLARYVGHLSAEQMRVILASWPGPITWLVPRGANAPDWITGTHDTVAIRVTAHPVAAGLCAAFDAPLVSTSANLHGAPAARSVADIAAMFAAGSLAGIVEGALGGRDMPSEIRDVVSGRIVRG
jgi:L-threonylcarbamoyladenylate synthase